MTSTLKFIETSKLPTDVGEFTVHAFTDEKDSKDHLAIGMGDLLTNEPVLSRIHSQCITGESFFSMRCDCRYQLTESLTQIAERGRGVVFYLQQEGRGIGLSNKIRAYNLQDQGLDTVEANHQLGFKEDERGYGIVSDMINFLGIKEVDLMTNNPKKIKEIRIDDDQDCVWLRVDVQGGASCHVGYRSCFYRSIPFGDNNSSTVLQFEEKEKVFDPKEVYGDAPNPTKL